jgi:hypothetical protein
VLQTLRHGQIEMHRVLHDRKRLASSHAGRPLHASLGSGISRLPDPGWKRVRSWP